MLFHKSYAELIIKTVGVILKHNIGSVLSDLVDLDKKGLSDSLYRFYAIDRRLVQTVGTRVARTKVKEYDLDLMGAKSFIRKGFNSPPLLRTKNAKDWFFFYLDSHSYTDTKYRLYINTKVGKLTEFIILLNQIISGGKIFCQFCGENKVGIIPRTEGGKTIQKFACSHCGSVAPSFKGKIHQPDTGKNPSPTLFRFDKVIFYFPDKDGLNMLWRMVKEMPSNLFDPYTPHFTHQLRPGVGISINPGDQELEDYNRALGESESIISAGEFLSAKIAEHLIDSVKSTPRDIEKLKGFLQETRVIGADRQKIYGEALFVLKPHVDHLHSRLLRDPAFIEWSKKIKEAHDHLLAS